MLWRPWNECDNNNNFNGELLCMFSNKYFHEFRIYADILKMNLFINLSWALERRETTKNHIGNGLISLASNW